MRALFAILLWSFMVSTAPAETARVAVASNFVTTATRLVEIFEAESDHRVELISGATGALYAQIVQGAPYDLFLAADEARVLLLDEAGHLAPLGRQIYAIGRLVLWSPDDTALAGDIAASLRHPGTLHFAMADPALAPYGRAAHQVIGKLGLADVAQEKAVIGANIGQTFAYVASGNAQMGFVALAQVTDLPGVWLAVPAGTHAPVVQAAGLLVRAAQNPAARGFFDFLQGAEARALIRDNGYGLTR